MEKIRRVIIAVALVVVIASIVLEAVAVNRTVDYICSPVVNEDTRPLLVRYDAVYYGTGDLCELFVEPKEKTKYVVHELTEEDIEEIEYYDSLELLAICVEAEAGNQDLMGKRLVADVILNRVDSDDFPNDIVSVITQKTGDVYQFSSYQDGNMDEVWEPSEETFKAVQMELKHRYNSDITYFTEGYYNPYCIPAFKYGSHYFGY